jgi:hypothetical protein
VPPPLLLFLLPPPPLPFHTPSPHGAVHVAGSVRSPLVASASSSRRPHELGVLFVAGATAGEGAASVRTSWILPQSIGFPVLLSNGQWL